jgi:hypothetical protein
MAVKSAARAPNPNPGTTIHFDRGIMTAFIGVILTLLVQTGSLVWWASSVNTTVHDQERRIVSMETWRGEMTRQNELLIRMDEQRNRQNEVTAKMTRDQETLERRVAQLENMLQRLPRSKETATR